MHMCPYVCGCMYVRTYITYLREYMYVHTIYCTCMPTSTAHTCFYAYFPSVLLSLFPSRLVSNTGQTCSASRACCFDINRPTSYKHRLWHRHKHNRHRQEHSHNIFWCSKHNNHSSSSNKNRVSWSILLLFANKVMLA